MPKFHTDTGVSNGGLVQPNCAKYEKSKTNSSDVDYAIYKYNSKEFRPTVVSLQTAEKRFCK